MNQQLEDLDLELLSQGYVCLHERISGDELQNARQEVKSLDDRDELEGYKIVKTNECYPDSDANSEEHNVYVLYKDMAIPKGRC